MRWFNFAIVLFVVLVVQISATRLFGIGPQRIMPDLLLLLAVVLAFRGSPGQAPIAGWILGLAKDLSSQSPLGSYALAFGLITLGLVHLRELFYGQSPLVLMVITFAAGFLAEQLVLAVCVFKKVVTTENYGAMSLAIIFSALLTAAIAPYGHWAVMKFHRQLGLASRRGYGR